MKAALFDGKELKGVNIPLNLDSDFGWDVWGENMKDDELYSRVAAVFRAIQLNANALSSLPFVLLDEQGNDYDQSDDWQNKVGFLPSPRELLRLWRVSLAMTNSAYGFMERKRGDVELRYIMPSTIQPIVDDRAGLVGFKRTINASSQNYSLKSGIIRHVYRLDYDTELLPSDNTEFRALMSAAGILFHADHFVQEFFKRGGIKPTILSVAGNLKPSERERVESYWDRFIKGFYKVSGKVFNAEAIDAKPVGDGVADLKDNEIYRQAIENVAMATGIPLSLLLSNSANYATAEAELNTWYSYSIVPYANFLADEMTRNLWSSFGLKMEFRPEQTDPDAQETMTRAQTFQVLMQTESLGNVNMPASLAAKIAGLTMPVGEEYDILDDIPEEEEPVIEKTEIEEDPEIEEETRSFTFDEFKELHDWRDIAVRKMKRGEPVYDMGWERKHITQDVHDEINENLDGASTIEEVKAAFDVMAKKEEPEIVQDEDIKSLAEALNNLASKAQPINLSMSPIDIVVNEKEVTVTPEIKAEAPIVNVTVPEQLAPVINVENKVDVPSVTVENNVDVQPAEVKIEPPKVAKVKRDINGNIDRIEAE